MMTSAVFKNASADKEMLFSQDLPDADFQRCAATLFHKVLPVRHAAVTGLCTPLEALSFIAYCSMIKEDVYVRKPCTGSCKRWTTQLIVWILFGRVFNLCQPVATPLQPAICYAFPDIWLHVFTCIQTMNHLYITPQNKHAT